jgi:hypothetical protein
MAPEPEQPIEVREGSPDADAAMAALRARLEETSGNERVLPEAVRSRWQRATVEANRKRVRVEVRVAEGTVPVETADGDVRGSLQVWAKGRDSLETKLATVELFSEACAAAERWLAGIPDVGAHVLREELTRFGQRLALLTPAALAHKKGGLPPIYVEYRSRILPLAWDNLVDALKVEALEDFARRVGEADRGTEKGARNRLAELAAEARGLVPPKEASGGSDDA